MKATIKSGSDPEHFNGTDISRWPPGLYRSGLFHVLIPFQHHWVFINASGAVEFAPVGSLNARTFTKLPAGSSITITV